MGKSLNCFLLFLFCTNAIKIVAQEKTCGLKNNSLLTHAKFEQQGTKTRSNSLPFFEDFTNQGPYPNASNWQDNKVYINNTFTNTQVARGVATFDALNEKGLSYYPSGNVASYYADSLTSKSFDFSSYTSADNIYLSFLYQPQGLGFKPETGDSLQLYFLTNTNTWVQVWSVEGNPNKPFTQVILPISSAVFMHNNFQFRFVNIASPATNDDVWNIDYIKLDKNRSLADTAIADVAFTLPPTSILANYTSMPYRHFVNNKNTEQDTIFTAFLNNNNVTNINTTITLVAKETTTNTNLFGGNAPLNIAGWSGATSVFGKYPIGFVPANPNDKVVIQNSFYINSVSPADPKQNDTIVQKTVFDNYFAYDDGCAEKAYFLYPALNMPAKTAMQFTLNVADTLQGLAVNFAKQVPSGAGKIFNITLYQNLGANTSTETVLHEQNFYTLQYVDTIQGFTTYAFDAPVPLQAGTYYIGITQPANNGSDSIYYGLDQNTNANANHLLYNVDGNWNASTTFGTVMMRPIVGSPFAPTALNEINNADTQITIYPNPANDYICFTAINAIKQINIQSINGQIMEHAQNNTNKINIQALPTGIYFLQFVDENNKIYYKKFIKN